MGLILIILNLLRSRGGWPAPSTQLPIQRRALAMQLQASKMFHQWAEVNFRLL